MWRKYTGVENADYEGTCGECHVGGGGMEYVMTAQGTNLATSDNRTDLRTNDNGGGPGILKHRLVPLLTLFQLQGPLLDQFLQQTI